MLLWKWDYDPDGMSRLLLSLSLLSLGPFLQTDTPLLTLIEPVYALPLLSSFLDVSGQLLLVGAFAISTTPTKSALGEVVGSELGGGGGGKQVLDGLIKRYSS